MSIDMDAALARPRARVGRRVRRALQATVRLVVGLALGLGLLCVVWLLDWAGEDYRDLP